MIERLFSKDNSSALKGVAILFMVFAHLFSRTEFCNLSNPLLYIKGEPVIHYMIFAMNPVDFFYGIKWLWTLFYF